MKRLLACLLCLSSLAFSAEEIGGFWKTVNEEGKSQCIIAIYEYEGLYYGRIIGSFDSQGKMTDSIYKPVKRAPGIIGNPYYSGLDIIWDLADSGSKFKGKIVDPEHGKVYQSELWINDSRLVVRGKLLFFGRSQEWLPASAHDFPKDFKKPDLKSFVPAVPEVN
ncbi:MAG: DUF2147 domain-containing protein [Verrucomicrobiota bacterium]|nr:DUF2147 domain-containing protein [Verrucomicrobiota bacterium]